MEHWTGDICIKKRLLLESKNPLARNVVFSHNAKCHIYIHEAVLKHCAIQIISVHSHWQ